MIKHCIAVIIITIFFFSFIPKAYAASCVFTVTNKDTGTQDTFLGTNSTKPDSFTILNEKYSYEYTVTVTGYDETDDCYIADEEWRGSFDEESIAKHIAAGCATGGAAGFLFTPLGGPAWGCLGGAWIVSASTLYGSIAATLEDWDRHDYYYDQNNCNTTYGPYTIRKPKHNKPSRITVQGHRWGIHQPDVNICSYYYYMTDFGTYDDYGKGTGFSAEMPGLCEQAGPQSGKCYECLNKYPHEEGEYKAVWTAIGCIPTDATTMIKSFISFAVGISGGLALLLILYGSFTVTISTGNPQKIDEGKQIITAAITGLVFIILSVAILQFIGIEIIRIPGI